MSRGRLAVDAPRRNTEPASAAAGAVRLRKRAAATQASAGRRPRCRPRSHHLCDDVDQRTRPGRVAAERARDADARVDVSAARKGSEEHCGSGGLLRVRISRGAGAAGWLLGGGKGLGLQHNGAIGFQLNCSLLWVRRAGRACCYARARSPLFL